MTMGPMNINRKLNTIRFRAHSQGTHEKSRHFPVALQDFRGNISNRYFHQQIFQGNT